MEGELMVVHRNNFQKVYDLTERVVPSHIDLSMPTDKNYYRHLIVNYLSANGIGTPEQISYLLKGHKPLILEECNCMLSDGLLIYINVEKKAFLALPDVTNLLNKSENNKQNLWTFLGMISFLLGDLTIINHTDIVFLGVSLFFFSIGKIFFCLRFSHKGDFNISRLVPFSIILFL